jgi:hypothetical protein
VAFLEILTRTFGQRPRMLRRCTDSLKDLHDPDWVQTIIRDEQGRGVAWANRNLASVDATGDYVWVLDDDDICCYHDLIGELKELVASSAPDVIMVRCYHAKFGMLPADDLWGQRPMMGTVGSSNVIVRREVWNEHRDGWREVYAGDFWFINRLWDAGLQWAWHYQTACYYPQQSNGATEDA